MAVVQNVTTNSGDVLYIKTDVPAVGLVLLSGFIDQTDGETINAFFYKEFAYSFDDLLWSDWQQLTNDNLVNVPVKPSKPLFLRYRYTRQGTDNVSSVGWDMTEVDGQVTQAVNGKYYSMSNFPCFFDEDDIETIDWYLNVTEKLYRQTDLLPKYITRFLTENWADKDFIDFWLSISRFFSYFVILARKITAISESNGKCDNLLLRYLEEWGLFMCGGENINQLNNLRIVLLSEFAKRGSINITTESSDVNKANGELLRIFCYSKNNEFLFNQYRPEFFGWNINNCSPLYKGLTTQININKFYEKTQFTDLTKYPIIDDVNASIAIEGSSNLLKFTIASTMQNGFEDTDLSKLIKINPYITYEFLFLVRTSSANISCDFGLKCYDKQLNQIQIFDSQSIGALQYAFQGKNIFSNSDFVVYHTILYGYKYNQVLLNDPVTKASYFKLQPNIQFITPIIRFTNNDVSSHDVYLSDVKLLPAFTLYDRGFIGVKNFSSLWIRNNSSRNYDEIREIIRRFLFPYDLRNEITFINDLELDDTLISPPPPTVFGLQLFFDWTGIVSGSSYNITFKYFDNGVQQPLQIYNLGTDNGNNAIPDATINVIDGDQYNVYVSHDYVSDLEYSIDNVNWTPLAKNIEVNVLLFTCDSNKQFYVRKRTNFHSQVAISNASVYEGTQIVFTALRTGDLGVQQTFDYATQDDTAIDTVNYNHVTGTITFNVGETQKTITVTTIDDGIGGAPDKQFKLNLSNATSGLTLSNTQALGIIKDNHSLRNLRVSKDEWTGNARAVLTKVTDSSVVFDYTNPNYFASTSGVQITNDNFYLKAYIDFTEDLSHGIEVIEIECQGEKQYIYARLGNIQFLNAKTPDINGNIDVIFRSCTFIGDEETATCDCDNGCVIGLFKVKSTGGGGLSYTVNLKDINTLAILFTISGMGNTNADAINVGANQFIIDITATSSGKTVRVSSWANQFFDEKRILNSVVTQYQNKTPNIYIEIEELS